MCKYLIGGLCGILFCLGAQVAAGLLFGGTGHCGTVFDGQGKTAVWYMSEYDRHGALTAYEFSGPWRDSGAERWRLVLRNTTKDTAVLTERTIGRYVSVMANGDVKVDFRGVRLQISAE